MIKTIHKAEQEGQNTPVQVSVVDGTLVNNFPAVQNVTGSVSVTNPVNVNVTNFSSQSAQIDAFGRQRTSNPFTLADYSHVWRRNRAIN